MAKAEKAPLSRAQRKAIRRAGENVRRAATARKTPVPYSARPARARHDAFISYAGEDRDAVARPLSEALARRGWTSWLADREVTATGSPRAIIDRGLRDARFGVVVLSRSYFDKFWPMAELDALLAREARVGGNIIVPVLHGIDRGDLEQLSPIMAGRMTISAKRGVERVAEEISRAFAKESGDRPAPLMVSLPTLAVKPVNNWTYEPIAAGSSK